MKRTITIILAFVMALILTACGNSQGKNYETAIGLLNNGEYKEAAEKFESLGSYEDASKMAMYAKAIGEAEVGNYKDANKMLSSLGEFKDCPQLISYYEGREFESNGIFNKAIEIYNNNPLFKDSKNRILECTYLWATESEDSGSYEAAIKLYHELGEYKDSAERYEIVKVKHAEVLETSYQTALLDLENGNYQTAFDTFTELKAYEDSEQLAQYCKARNYEDVLGRENFDYVKEAYNTYINIPEVLDSKQRASSLESFFIEDEWLIPCYIDESWKFHTAKDCEDIEGIAEEHNFAIAIESGSDGCKSCYGYALYTMVYG